MPNEKLKEARRIARDVAKQRMDDIKRPRDSKAAYDASKFVHDNSDKIIKKLRTEYPNQIYREYGDGQYSLVSGIDGKDFDGINPYESSDPSKYGR